MSESPANARLIDQKPIEARNAISVVRSQADDAVASRIPENQALEAFCAQRGTKGPCAASNCLISAGCAVCAARRPAVARIIGAIAKKSPASLCVIAETKVPRLRRIWM